MCVCGHTHACMHACTCAWHVCTHAHMCMTCGDIRVHHLFSKSWEVNLQNNVLNTHTHVHMCMHMCVCVYTHTCMHVRVRVSRRCIYMCVRANLWGIHVCIRTVAVIGCKCTNMCVSMYTCMCVCVCVYETDGIEKKIIDVCVSTHVYVHMCMHVRDTCTMRACMIATHASGFMWRFCVYPVHIPDLKFRKGKLLHNATVRIRHMPVYPLQKVIISTCRKLRCYWQCTLKSLKLSEVFAFLRSLLKPIPLENAAMWSSSCACCYARRLMTRKSLCRNSLSTCHQHTRNAAQRHICDVMRRLGNPQKTRTRRSKRFWTPCG